VEAISGGVYCLGYVEEISEEWKCQDSSLVWVNQSFVTGVTDHFTSFAIILEPNSENQIAPKGSPPPLSNAVIAGVVVAVFVVIVGITTAIVLYLRRRESDGSKVMMEVYN